MSDRVKTLDAVPPALFSLGQVVATPAALKLLQDNNLTPFHFLMRHAAGDWGESLPATDRAANDAAVQTGDRLLSAYQVGDGRIWLISEADRSATTILLPHEY